MWQVIWQLKINIFNEYKTVNRTKKWYFKMYFDHMEFSNTFVFIKSWWRNLLSTFELSTTDGWHSIPSSIPLKHYKTEIIAVTTFKYWKIFLARMLIFRLILNHCWYYQWKSRSIFANNSKPTTMYLKNHTNFSSCNGFSRSYDKMSNEAAITIFISTIFCFLVTSKGVFLFFYDQFMFWLSKKIPSDNLKDLILSIGIGMQWFSI